MIELSPEELGIAWPLLRGFPHKQDFIHSVYERKQQGRVFVDAKDRPTVTVLIHRGGNVVLAGDVQSPMVGEFLKKEFLSPLRDRPWAQLVPESEAGGRVIVGALGPKVTKVRRLSFLYDKNKSGAIAGWRTTLSPTQAVRRIDERLLARIAAEHHDHILEDWDSAASFLEHGAGFCMVAGGRIATVCYSVTSGKRIMPIQVDTGRTPHEGICVCHVRGIHRGLPWRGPAAPLGMRRFKRRVRIARQEAGFFHTCDIQVSGTPGERPAAIRSRVGPPGALWLGLRLRIRVP